DTQITERLRLLSRKHLGMPLVALGALADGYDRSCVLAAHLSLLNQRTCEYLGVPSPDQIFNFRRPITEAEVEAQKLLYPARKAEYVGIKQIGDNPESSSLMWDLASQHAVGGPGNGPWKVVTLAGSKGKTATLITRNGEARLI